MIRRIAALLFIVWALGFAWFAVFLPQPADARHTDGAVVLTGGPNRIARGLELIERNQADRLLISGVDRDVRPRELAVAYKRPMTLFECCIDLGFQSVDTRSNALETARWARRTKIRSLRLVTDDWHMRRARMELNLALDDKITVTEDAVPTRPSLGILFKEYNKFWLRGLSAMFGI